jgi:hypothetical protein
MPPSSSLLTRSFLVGVLIVSTSYGASALTVKRTSTLIDGVFVPVLVVESNGETIIHRVGEDGLTRSILFDERKALRWAKARYGCDTAVLAGGTAEDGADCAGLLLADGGGDRPDSRRPSTPVVSDDDDDDEPIGDDDDDDEGGIDEGDDDDDEGGGSF